MLTVKRRGTQTVILWQSRSDDGGLWWPEAQTDKPDAKQTETRQHNFNRLGPHGGARAMRGLTQHCAARY
eukprot:8927888-Lingulodinium_polyedra.AAC.1